MKVTRTAFEGLLIVEPNVITDTRGYFYESFSKRSYLDMGLSIEFVQENQSQSRKNVIRGLHYQTAPHAQAKLIKVLTGRILDVVIDLRKDQPTFKKVFSIELEAGEKKQLFIPKGFAHGFSVLSDSAEVLYGCDEYYHSECEVGILHSDPALGIDWKIKSSDRIVSEKDLALPVFSSSTCCF